MAIKGTVAAALAAAALTATLPLTDLPLPEAATALRERMAREGLVPSTVPAPAVGGSAVHARISAAAPAETGHRAATRPAGSAASHRFETVSRSGAPARWETCDTIPVVVYTAGAPSGVVAEVRAALAQVNAASGLRFTLTKTVNRALTAHESDHPTRPVVVGFASGSSGVFANATQAGLTSVATQERPGGRQVILGSTVAFNTDLLPTFTPGATGADPRMALLLHEFGHMAGLDHVDDASQIMFAQTGHATTLGAGDLAGLAKLGSPACTPAL